jgi:extracellular factor (EF) 3-hydroxypalmitic acid methyl ester biosynthesis protein
MTSGANSSDLIVPAAQAEVERNALSGDDLLAAVRAAAERLVEHLRAAETATAGWQHPELSTQLVAQGAGTCLASLAATNCWGEANRVPSSELWRVAGEWLVHGELQTQARFKPRGYAGDYDLLAKICDDWRCEHPLGRAFDAFFQAQAAPQAVRHRTEIVAKQIVEQCRRQLPSECHVVSIGSGPARDVELALRELPPGERRHLRITLLDLDPLALEHAQARLAPFLSADQLVIARENLFRLPKNARARSLMTGANFLSCVGFFDYLAEADAAELLAAFWRELAPGGRMMVFNFTPENPSRAYMEWLGNWYLIYRTPRELASLARRAGLPSEDIRIDCEELGIDAFLAADKPAR